MIKALWLWQKNKIQIRSFNQWAFLSSTYLPNFDTYLALAVFWQFQAVAGSCRQYQDCIHLFLPVFFYIIVPYASLKAYVSKEILNRHCLSLSLNADLCIHFYWLSRLREASHRKMIQSSTLRQRIWPCHFKISSDTPALSLM